MGNRKIIPERRKKYGWLVFATIFSWVGVGLIWLYVDPQNIRDLIIPGSYLLFVLIFSLAAFLLLTIIFLSPKHAVWWTVGLIIFFYLRIYGLGNLLNGFLLFGILVCGELYFRIDKKKNLA